MVDANLFQRREQELCHGIKGLVAARAFCQRLDKGSTEGSGPDMELLIFHGDAKRALTTGMRILFLIL